MDAANVTKTTYVDRDGAERDYLEFRLPCRPLAEFGLRVARERIVRILEDLLSHVERSDVRS